MQCPKCESEFDTFTYANVEVDRCTGCGGIWFDALEKEELERIKAAGSIDAGDERVGEQYNEMRNINCPKCGVKMLKMVDRTQFHIEFESCPTCYGNFFDAGEFKDLGKFTVVERFKQMIDFWRAAK